MKRSLQRPPGRQRQAINRAVGRATREEYAYLRSIETLDLTIGRLSRPRRNGVDQVTVILLFGDSSPFRGRKG